VFAVLVRLSHSGPLYFMLFAFMIWVAILVA
jgi:hypothetical protein